MAPASRFRAVSYLLRLLADEPFPVLAARIALGGAAYRAVLIEWYFDSLGASGGLHRRCPLVNVVAWQKPQRRLGWPQARPDRS